MEKTKKYVVLAYVFMVLTLIPFIMECFLFPSLFNPSTDQSAVATIVLAFIGAILRAMSIIFGITLILLIGLVTMFSIYGLSNSSWKNPVFLVPFIYSGIVFTSQIVLIVLAFTL